MFHICIYIETIVVYKVCRRPVKQFRVITSTCAPIRSCRPCKNKKKKEKKKKKGTIHPVKIFSSPGPTFVGLFADFCLDVDAHEAKETRWMHYYPKMSRKDTSQTSSGSLAQRCFVQSTKRATCYRLVSRWSQIHNLAFNALKSLHTGGIENYIYNICCLTVKAGISGKIRMIREKCQTTIVWLRDYVFCFYLCDTAMTLKRPVHFLLHILVADIQKFGDRRCKLPNSTEQ